MWFKRHVLYKSMRKKEEKKYGREGPSIKKDEHMKAHVKRKGDSHVLKIKLMREITHIKEYSIGLTLFYPNTCTS